ncbi:MAG: pyridoxal-phosphate dependent enzyme [Anaerolineae bacterium]|nr:pyridoxal-phosphate dependent enzyme [Anaerolineae bacterium]NIN99112.1 pyridoxal-phosphate dependent enzyme [Anaerolineae bacterium]NIQ81953.1 pyridoxal-phosphate dependent enzyme [Anaerolineae bacterium]
MPGTSTVSSTQAPALQDILAAQKRIRRYLSPTPLHHYPLLSELVGTDIWVKHENHQPIGAFKVRGGINLVSQLSPGEKERGVITASTGNHGQSIAYAARLFGVQAIVGMPEGSNPGKVAAIRNLGAEVLFHGHDFDDARQRIEALAQEEGYRYVSSGDEPDLIAGVGTYTLEILQQLPDAEVIIVPVGGGSGASGACIAAKAIDPFIQIIGVQAEKAPAAYLTWKGRERVEANMETFAEGLATRAPFMLPQSILWEFLDDFVLVSEEEMLECIVHFLERTHNLAEGAAAASLAGALKIKDRLAGKKVVLIMTGGNLSLANLRRALDLRG